MGPDQRHRRSGSPASEEFPRWNIIRVPKLFRDHPALARKAFQSAQQPLGFPLPPSRQLIVSALSGEQWPGSSDAGPIEGRAIFMLAVEVVNVSAPGWPVVRLHFEQRINRFHRVDDAWIISRAQTEAYQRQRIGADDESRRPGGLVRWAALDRDKSVAGRGCIRL